MPSVLGRGATEGGVFRRVGGCEFTPHGFWDIPRVVGVSLVPQDIAGEGRGENSFLASLAELTGNVNPSPSIRFGGRGRGKRENTLGAVPEIKEGKPWDKGLC